MGPLELPNPLLLSAITVSQTILPVRASSAIRCASVVAMKILSW